MKLGKTENAIRSSRFPKSLFFAILADLLIMGGLHFALMWGMIEADFSPILIVHIILAYWSGVAAIITLYVRSIFRRAYEEPMHKLADATAKIAEGDFSVRVDLDNKTDKLDYLDVMISDFNKMAEELCCIETLRVDFFSNVSHEIKTPIAVIQNSAELLKRNDLSDEKKSEYVNTICDAAKRLNTLITNILKLNKLEKQSITLNVTEFDLCEQLVQSALMFENIWESKEIEFDAELEDESLMIRADEELLPLLWNNLLSNAFKFTEKGGTVRLTERQEGECIIVTVEDSGCGMDEQTVKHIFDKFYQGDTSHSVEGNGLGLALALRVLQLTGGSIDVESDPGKGARFIVTLRQSRRAAAKAKE